MKSPGSGKSPGSKGKAGKGKKAKGGKFPTTKELRREYKADARREEASSHREQADAAHRRAEAAHYEHEAAKAEREGYKKEAEYDLAKARREMAEARHDTAKARRNQAKSRRSTVKASHAGLAIPGAIADGWILGGNDWHRGCAAVALANHLYAATGLRVSDRDVLELYWLTADDPDTGASVLATLEAAAEFGLGGMRPAWEDCADGWADEDQVGDPGLPGRGHRLRAGRHRRHRPAVPGPLILDLRLQQAQRHQPVWDVSPSPDWGAHAGVLAGDKVITWGREVPVTGDFLATRVAAAWTVEWAATPAAMTRRPAPTAAYSR